VTQHVATSDYSTAKQLVSATLIHILDMNRSWLIADTNTGRGCQRCSPYQSSRLIRCFQFFVFTYSSAVCNDVMSSFQATTRYRMISTLVSLATLLHLWFPFASSTAAVPQTSTSVRVVTDPLVFQRAIVDGVRHIVVGSHINVNDLQADPEGSSQSLDKAIGDLTPNTRSIVVRCFLGLRWTEYSISGSMFVSALEVCTPHSTSATLASISELLHCLTAYRVAGELQRGSSCRMAADHERTFASWGLRGSHT
jgi:hypothetical protein